MRLSSLAHSVGVGCLLWTTWQPCGAGETTKYRTRIRSGSMLVMLDKLGASRLRCRLPGFRPENVPSELANILRPGPTMGEGHWDVALRQLLEHPGPVLGMGYVTPPSGNYATHPSAFDRRFHEGRPSCWRESWCVPGTRPEDDRRNADRWIVGFTKRGTPTWLRKVVLPDDPGLAWRSFWLGEGDRPGPPSLGEPC